MDFGEIVAICSGVAAIIGLFMLLSRIGKWFYVFIRKASAFIDDLMGELPRPGLPEDQRRKGLMDRMQILESNQQSLMSAQAAMAAEMVTMATEVESMKDRIAALESIIERNVSV